MEQICLNEYKEYLINSYKHECDNNEIENTIRLVTRIDGKTRSISVHLSAADHVAACDAYRDDREVEIAGTLDKSQSRWFFTEVTGFRVL